MLGVASAYFGSTFDLLFQRVMEVFMAFLLIILALAIVPISGGGTDKVILAITIPFIPRYARVVRSNALAIREMPEWMPPVLRVFASPDHSMAHGAKLDGALPDYALQLSGAGDPHGSLLIFPWNGHAAKTYARLGLSVAGWCRICGKRTFGADLPGSRDHAGRITILSIWGCGARYPGSTFAIAITRRCFAVLAILPISRSFGTGRVRPVGEVVRLQLEDASYR